jgi:hypothetical protein
MNASAIKILAGLATLACFVWLCWLLLGVQGQWHPFCHDALDNHCR